MRGQSRTRLELLFVRKLEQVNLDERANGKAEPKRETPDVFRPAGRCHLRCHAIGLCGIGMTTSGQRHFYTNINYIHEQNSGVK